MPDMNSYLQQLMNKSKHSFSRLKHLQAKKQRAMGESSSEEKRKELWLLLTLGVVAGGLVAAFFLVVFFSY